jgi:hypothetical protein
MARVSITYPAADWERADNTFWILTQWASHWLRGQPGIKGKTVGPRYKGQKVNVESASPRFLKATGWASHIEIYFTDPDVFNYLRDIDLPDGAVMKVG